MPGAVCVQGVFYTARVTKGDFHTDFALTHIKTQVPSTEVTGKGSQSHCCAPWGALTCVIIIIYFLLLFIIMSMIAVLPASPLPTLRGSSCSRGFLVQQFPAVTACSTSRILF